MCANKVREISNLKEIEIKLDVLSINFDHTTDTKGSLKGITKFIKNSIYLSETKKLDQFSHDLTALEVSSNRAQKKLNTFAGSDLGSLSLLGIYAAYMVPLCGCAITILFFAISFFLSAAKGNTQNIFFGIILILILGSLFYIVFFKP